MTETTRPAAVPADEALLSRSDDLLQDFDRAFRMFQEFVTGCRTLYDIGQAVTVFGSARFDEAHRYYKLARELGRELARHRYTVVTGGGPGIMVRLLLRAQGHAGQILRGIRADARRVWDAR